MTTPSPYPGYYQASDGQWYPNPVAAPPPPAPGPPPPPAAGYQQQPALAPVLARGTLEDWADQPTGGGGAATSKFFTPQRPQGSWLRLRVTRDLNHADVKQQTDKFGKPLTFTGSGKPKFVLIIPCQVLSSSDPASASQHYSDGAVTVWLKGVPSDAFKSAMAAAGVNDPSLALLKGQLAGAEFYMVSAGTKQFGNGNPANMFDFTYTSNGRELAESAHDQAIAAVAVPPTAPPAPALTPAVPAVVTPPPPAPGAVPPPPPAAATPPPPPVAAPTPPAPPAPAPAAADPYPGHYQASDGQWYPVAAQAAPAPPPVSAPPAPPGVPAPQVDARKAALLQQLQGQAQ